MSRWRDDFIQVMDEAISEALGETSEEMRTVAEKAVAYIEAFGWTYDWNEEPMTTPDPDNAAAEAIAAVIATKRHTQHFSSNDIAQAVLDLLRDHPEHGPWPVMTASEARVFIQERNNAVGSGEDGASALAGTLIIPDPPADPEPLPTVDLLAKAKVEAIAAIDGVYWDIGILGSRSNYTQAMKKRVAERLDRLAAAAGGQHE